MIKMNTKEQANRLVDRLLESVGVTWQELPNGDLKILADPDMQACIKDRESGNDIFDYLEGMLGNGFDVIHPEEIAALTDAPIIGYDVERSDQGELLPSAGMKVWWYPEYQVRDPLDDLVEKGELVFTRAKEE